MEEGVREWTLDGVEFPDEPMPWIAEIVGDAERGVRPRPDFDVAAWPAANGHVAVVHVNPISTPPCIANGTVYERLPGKTQTVRDPRRLADLFSRGDEARKEAQAAADRAARVVMEALEGPAGVFQSRQALGAPDADEPSDDDRATVRFAVGIAATGKADNIAGRLFRDEFLEEVWERLRSRPLGLPRGWGAPPDPVEWSQEALTWRHQTGGPLRSITVVRAAWDGSAAAGEKLATEDVSYPDSLATHRVAPAWRLADQLVAQLDGFGDLYVTVLLGGGRWPRREDARWIVMRRGPLLAGVEDEQVASLARETMRAVGNAGPEP